jgi:hypothetical protein
MNSYNLKTGKKVGQIIVKSIQFHLLYGNKMIIIPKRGVAAIYIVNILIGYT